MRLATRGSALALAQAGLMRDRLPAAELVEVSGDHSPDSGDKSRFVRGVEETLLEGRAEIGVHSAKDVPAELPAGLVIAGVPERAEAADAWIGAGGSLGDVAEGARVGTASLRRRSQLLAARPDLEVTGLHGNVDTRLAKLASDDYDAIVLAAAGLERLGRGAEISFLLGAGQMTPSPGQGALILQTRADDAGARDAASSLSDDRALTELTAERTVVGMLEATCATPIGVHAVADGDDLMIDAYVGLPDGTEWIRDRVEGEAAQPAAVAEELGERLLAAGAAAILERAETSM